MLSIVAIGWNEAENLLRLGRSIAALRDAVGFPVESIYVDSASTDDSAAVAAECFDSVVELEASPHLCASAGRFAGTLEAKYPWIFYIDGDMEICPQFFDVIAKLNDIEPECLGIIGMYVHRFDNCSVATQVFRRSSRLPSAASQFGGAVILRRDAVLAAGNWDPSVYGKEEMELYVRLGNGRPVVNYITLPMVFHYSEYYSRMELALRLISPSAGLGKVFWGYGQSLRALATKRKLRALLRLEYKVSIFWASLLLALLVALLLPLAWGMTLVVAVLLGFSIWLRPGSIIRYLSLPLSLIPGWFKYLPWFRPKLLKWEATDESAL
jgi:glycosyltransferase involved in cell wall biosynthesis